MKKTKEIREWIDLDLHCTLEELIEELIEIKEEYTEKGLGDLTLDFDAGYNSISVALLGTRLETEYEYMSRTKREDKIKQNKLDKERARYLELKKKFENES